MIMKKSDLLKHIEDKGLLSLVEEKMTNKELEQILGIDYYNNNPDIQSWGMRRRVYDLQRCTRHSLFDMDK